jgi:hypothetical protein
MKSDGSGAGRRRPDHDDPEVDEILAAFHRPPRAPGAGVALSELVAEPTPRAPELTENDGATFVLPRTRDRHRRRKARMAAVAAVVATFALAGALWLALRRPVRSPSTPEGSGSREAPNSAEGAGPPLVAPRLPPAGGSASVEGRSGPPSAKALAVPSPSSSGEVPPASRHPRGSPGAGSNLDPEYKRSM